MTNFKKIVMISLLGLLLTACAAPQPVCQLPAKPTFQIGSQDLQEEMERALQQTGSGNTPPKPKTTGGNS